MAWIESHQSLATHGKLLRLARELGIQKHQAIGHLHCLWWWAIDNATDGSLEGHEPSDIAEVAGWIEQQLWWQSMHTYSPTESEKIDGIQFFIALVKTGWIDLPGEKSSPIEGRFVPDKPLPPETRLHDWLDYCGDLVKKRLERKIEQHRKSDVLQKQLSAGRKVPSTVPYRTVPKKNNDNPLTPLPPRQPLDERFQRLIQLREHCTGRLCTGQDSDHIKDYLLHHTEEEIASAIRKAGEAKSLAWKYVDTCLEGGNDGRKTYAQKEHAPATQRVNPIWEPTEL